jgi:cysteine desulfurase
MGLEPGAARSALRVTLGPETTDAEVDAFAAALRDALVPLREALEALG